MATSPQHPDGPPEPLFGEPMRAPEAAWGPGGVAVVIVLAMVALAGVVGAIANPQAVGVAGLVFLIAVTLAGAGFLVAVAGMPRRAAAPDALPLVLADAIRKAPDPCAVTRGGTLVFANAAYRTLAQTEEGAAPVSPAFLKLGPEMAGRLYRLMRAARLRQPASEELRFAAGTQMRALHVSVEPLADRRLAVWWFRSKPGPALALQVDNVVPFPAAADAPAEPEEAAAAAEAAAPPAAPDADPETPPQAGAVPAAVPEPAMLSTDIAAPARAHEAGDPRDPRFVRFFHNAPVGIAFVEADGTIAEANGAFARLIGVPAGVLKGVRFADRFKGDDRPAVAARLAAAQTGEVPATPLDVRLSGDPERSGHLYTSRLDGPDGAGVVAYVIDVTEQKQLELHFAQGQKLQAVGQLAGGVAHDFNNLLTAIIGYCDLLLARHRVGDPSYSDLDQIKQNANRAANLVRQLLAFSRKQTLQPKILSLSDVLTELRVLLRRVLGERVRLEMELAPDLGLVRADQSQFETALINLAVNARDAMPEGGTLAIRTYNIGPEQARALGHALMPAADYVCIAVADTGSGIPKEILGQIFEPFFTTKAPGEGTGLGLATVYGIVKQTGGFIFAESEPGQGAVFRIYLPRFFGAAPAAADEEARAPLKDLTGMGTILLVEDEDAVRSFAARALKTRGYTVLEAPNGEAALETVRAHDGPIHLMISDVVMPGMDGPTLVAHARELRPDMRIVFISGYAEDAFRKSGERLDEAFAFLPKPFGLKQLAAKVKDVLSGG